MALWPARSARVVGERDVEVGLEHLERAAAGAAAAEGAVVADDRAVDGDDLGGRLERGQALDRGREHADEVVVDRRAGVVERLTGEERRREDVAPLLVEGVLDL